MLDPSRRIDGLNDHGTIGEGEVESARRQQVVMKVGALSNKELKPLIEGLSGCVVLAWIEGCSLRGLTPALCRSAKTKELS
jgi:hypothetical protein